MTSSGKQLVKPSACVLLLSVRINGKRAKRDAGSGPSSRALPRPSRTRPRRRSGARAGSPSYSGTSRAARRLSHTQTRLSETHSEFSHAVLSRRFASNKDRDFWDTVVRTPAHKSTRRVCANHHQVLGIRFTAPVRPPPKPNSGEIPTEFPRACQDRQRRLALFAREIMWGAVYSEEKKLQSDQTRRGTRGLMATNLSPANRTKAVEISKWSDSVWFGRRLSDSELDCA